MISGWQGVPELTTRKCEASLGRAGVGVLQQSIFVCSRQTSVSASSLLQTTTSSRSGSPESSTTGLEALPGGRLQLQSGGLQFYYFSILSTDTRKSPFAVQFAYSSPSILFRLSDLEGSCSCATRHPLKKVVGLLSETPSRLSPLHGHDWAGEAPFHSGRAGDEPVAQLPER